MQRWLDLLLALLPAGVVHRMVVRLGWTVVRRSGRGLTEEKHTMNRNSKSRGHCLTLTVQITVHMLCKS